jgi:hypothetical protein
LDWNGNQLNRVIILRTYLLLCDSYIALSNEETFETIMDNIILTFKDQQYPLAKVLGKGKSGPPVEVKLADLNISNEAVFDLIKLSQESAEYDNGPVIFYKHEGQYILFGGKQKALAQIAKGATTVKGTLLTSFALKGIRIEKPMAESAKIEAIAALTSKFSSTHSNRVETKPRTYGSKPSYPRTTSGQPLHARSK